MKAKELLDLYEGYEAGGFDWFEIHIHGGWENGNILQAPNGWWRVDEESKQDEIFTDYEVIGFHTASNGYLVIDVRG